MAVTPSTAQHSPPPPPQPRLPSIVPARNIAAQPQDQLLPEREHCGLEHRGQNVG